MIDERFDTWQEYVQALARWLKATVETAETFDDRAALVLRARDEAWELKVFGQDHDEAAYRLDVLLTQMVEIQ